MAYDWENLAEETAEGLYSANSLTGCGLPDFNSTDIVTVKIPQVVNLPPQSLVRVKSNGSWVEPLDAARSAASFVTRFLEASLIAMTEVTKVMRIIALTKSTRRLISRVNLCLPFATL